MKELRAAVAILVLLWAWSASAAYLTWKYPDPSNADGFFVYRASLPSSLCGEFDRITEDPVPLSQLWFLDPTKGLFCYYITAMNESSESPPSEVGQTPASVVLVLKFRSKSTNGTVVSSPSGISANLAGAYSAYFSAWVPVTFTATPGSHSKFQGWDGACAAFASSPLCTLTLTTSNTQIVARFTRG